MSTFSLPDTIDKSGTTDVTAPLNAWVAATNPQPGDEVVFEGTLKLSDSLKLGQPNVPLTGIRFDLTATNLSLPQALHIQYGRSILRCINLHQCEVIGGTLIGANTTWADGVIDGLEGWNGISVGGGSTDVLLQGQTIKNVWGDFFGIGGGNNAHITFDSLTCDSTGRHGFSIRSCTDLKVTNSTFSKIRHLFCDFEPASGDGLDGLEIGHCTGPAGGHGIFLQLLPLLHTPCQGIWVHDHVLTNGHYRMSAGTGGQQRSGFRL